MTVSEESDEERMVKVREWLENAAEYVNDARTLLEVLDDSHDF